MEMVVKMLVVILAGLTLAQAQSTSTDSVDPITTSAPLENTTDAAGSGDSTSMLIPSGDTPTTSIPAPSSVTPSTSSDLPIPTTTAPATTNPTPSPTTTSSDPTPTTDAPPTTGTTDTPATTEGGTTDATTTDATTTDATTTDATTTGATTTDATTTGATSTDATSTTTTSAGSDRTIGIVAGAVGTVVALILVVAIIATCLFLLYRRRDSYKSSSSSGGALLDMALEDITTGALGQDGMDSALLFAHIDVSKLVTVDTVNLRSHVTSLHGDSGYLAEEEYDAVKEYDPVCHTSNASKPSNEPKNRYINILPRDETRVMLTPLPKITSSDYINANYVDGYNSPREYIASQGPLPNTIVDFWRMIWEQGCIIIVMVTNPMESGMVKCEQYWPNRGVIQYGDILVSLRAEQLFPEFIVRQFNISIKKDDGIKKLVTQFHFTSWPDFGVPQEASSMLKFVRHIRRLVASSEGRCGPILTHCSAGVGRTGTFIAVDILLQKMEEENEEEEEEGEGEGEEREEGEERKRKRKVLNVQEVVCKMRAQRGCMVQTGAQYLFIYDSLLHAYTHGDVEVHVSHLEEYVASLSDPISEALPGLTRLDKEFNHVMSVKFPSDHFFSVATDTINESKNRDQDSIPLDHNYVALQGCDDEEDDDDDDDRDGGGDYINASYINGYYNRVEFIATQHPLANTRTDFWSMVNGNPSHTIVILGSLKEPEDRYWPEGDEVFEYRGGMTVSVGEEEEEEEGMMMRGGKKDEDGVKEKEGGAKKEEGGVEKEEGGAKKEEDGVKKEEEGGNKEEMGGAKEEEGGAIIKEGGVNDEEGGAKEERGALKEGIIVRNFVIKMDEEETYVRMLHLEGWSVEASSNFILGVIDRSRQHWRETGFNPIVVHTATGVSGEVAGVYCGLCIMLRQAEVEGAVDMVTTMEKIRQQRPSIFTSKEYYRYMYEVLAGSLKN